MESVTIDYQWLIIFSARGHNVPSYILNIVLTPKSWSDYNDMRRSQSLKLRVPFIKNHIKMLWVRPDNNIGAVRLDCARRISMAADYSQISSSSGSAIDHH
uniref:Uncharacterized protein n=1 Tax=Spongospora subterranea TaxID=70186 RepID=A0A0H5QZG8_9EUKA|eukprot:CRZ00959.1 hypothetical protein [Spongospora subterranea]